MGAHIFLLVLVMVLFIDYSRLRSRVEARAWDGGEGRRGR